jgi:hypothetical protein
MENFLQPNFISTATNASISQTLSTSIIDTRKTVPEWKAHAKILANFSAAACKRQIRNVLVWINTWPFGFGSSWVCVCCERELCKIPRLLNSCCHATIETHQKLFRMSRRSNACFEIVWYGMVWGASIIVRHSACRMNHTKVIIIQKAEICFIMGMADN